MTEGDGVTTMDTEATEGSRPYRTAFGAGFARQGARIAADRIGSGRSGGDRRAHRHRRNPGGPTQRRQSRRACLERFHLQTMAVAGRHGGHRLPGLQWPTGGTHDLVRVGCGVKSNHQGGARAGRSRPRADVLPALAERSGTDLCREGHCRSRGDGPTHGGLAARVSLYAPRPASRAVGRLQDDAAVRLIVSPVPFSPARGKRPCIPSPRRGGFLG